MEQRTEGRERAVLEAILDCLLPGDGDFPPASATEAAADVVAHAGDWLRPGLASVEEEAGGDFLAVDGARRSAVLGRVEAGGPAFFDALVELAYYCYYMQPAVAAAIRRMGIEYHQAPMPAGYGVELFDPANPEMMPRTPRGTYVRTEDVTRVTLR